MAQYEIHSSAIIHCVACTEEPGIAAGEKGKKRTVLRMVHRESGHVVGGEQGGPGTETGCWPRVAAFKEKAAREMVLKGGRSLFKVRAEVKARSQDSRLVRHASAAEQYELGTGKVLAEAMSADLEACNQKDKSGKDSHRDIIGQRAGKRRREGYAQVIVRIPWTRIGV